MRGERSESTAPRGFRTTLPCRIEIREVRGDLSDFSGMTFPAYGPLLSRASFVGTEDGRTVAMNRIAHAAWLEDEMIGLALATHLPDQDDIAQLLSVYVVPYARNRGVASALVGAIELAASRYGIRELACRYTTGKASIEFVERILARRGWSPPRTGGLLVRFAPREALESHLLSSRMMSRMSRSLEIAPWSEVTQDEKSWMRRSNLKEGWIPEGLDPWSAERLKAHDSSVAARYRGRVVGWIIVHQVGRGTARLSVGFARPDLPLQGSGLSLLAECLKVLVAAGFHHCSFSTSVEQEEMIRLIQRRFVEFANVVEMRRSSLELAKLS